MQTGSSGTLIGWKSGQTTFVPLWDRMEGAWLRTQFMSYCLRGKFATTLLDGTNVRLNWNIESDLNVYWIKFKNFLSLY
jgi:hypothetical protein